MDYNTEVNRPQKIFFMVDALIQMSPYFPHIPVYFDELILTGAKGAPVFIKTLTFVDTKK